MTQCIQPVPSERFLWEETIPGGCHWSGHVKRGTAFRITDVSGNANLSALFFRSDLMLERYNMPDTLKSQHTAMLTLGHALYSDMGRVMCSIISDTCGWHDTIGGLSTDSKISMQYDQATYQTHRNAMHRSAEDGFLIEMQKYGLGKKDLVPNVNFFSKVAVSENGSLEFRTNHKSPGNWLDLRFDMDVVVVFSSAPHPLDIKNDYTPGDLIITAWKSGFADENDVSRTKCVENRRGFYRTEQLYR